MAPPDRKGIPIRRRTALKSMAVLGLTPIRAANPASAVLSALVRASAPRTITQALATPVPTGVIGYAFNAKSNNVTLFDPDTQQVLATKPLAAVVRWLSNEQRFWDGRHIWSYDFPEDKVQAIAIDPVAITVDRVLPTGGAGPAHSLMLTPDRSRAWVNVAGDDYLAVFDLAFGQVVSEVKTGKFP